MKFNPTGPIGAENFLHLAIARTFRIDGDGRNTYTASCKICGAECLPDSAMDVTWCIYGDKERSIYVCRGCFPPIKEANEKFHWWEGVAGEGETVWWRNLDRPPRDASHWHRPTRAEILASMGKTEADLKKEA